MKLLDLLILIPLLWGAVNGYRKGLLVEIVGIAAFVVAMIVGFKFLGLGMEILEPHIGHTLARRILPFIGFSIIFFPTVFLLNQFGYSIRRSLKYTLLGTFDSLAGGAVGLFTWVFGTSVFFWLLSTMGVDIPEHRTQETYVYPFIVPVAPVVITTAVEWMPRGSQLIRDWKHEYLDGERKEAADAAL
ncbi:MAG: CvpA family protein [Bacteroidetes bacterium]|nr:CvpA family protein [Bacteroidota bacterium]